MSRLLAENGLNLTVSQWFFTIPEMVITSKVKPVAVICATIYTTATSKRVWIFPRIAVHRNANGEFIIVPSLQGSRGETLGSTPDWQAG